MKSPAHNRLAIALLVLLFVPAAAQAQAKVPRHRHHRAVARHHVETPPSSAETPANATRAQAAQPIPVSWLLAILAVTVAIAFAAFTGTLFTPEHAGSPQPAATQMKWHY